MWRPARVVAALLVLASLPVAGASPLVAGERLEPRLSLRGQVVVPPPAAASGGGLSLTGRVTRPGLVSAGGELALAATSGLDTTLVAGCECLCAGADIFSDGFESGAASAWSAAVP